MDQKTGRMNLRNKRKDPSKPYSENINEDFQDNASRSNNKKSEEITNITNIGNIAKLLVDFVQQVNKINRQSKKQQQKPPEKVVKVPTPPPPVEEIPKSEVKKKVKIQKPVQPEPVVVATNPPPIPKKEVPPIKKPEQKVEKVQKKQEPPKKNPQLYSFRDQHKNILQNNQQKIPIQTLPNMPMIYQYPPKFTPNQIPYPYYNIPSSPYMYIPFNSYPKQAMPNFYIQHNIPPPLQSQIYNYMQLIKQQQQRAQMTPNMPPNIPQQQQPQQQQQQAFNMRQMPPKINIHNNHQQFSQRDMKKIFKRASYHVAIAYNIYLKKQLKKHNNGVTNLDISKEIEDPTQKARKLRDKKNNGDSESVQLITNPDPEIYNQQKKK